MHMKRKLFSLLLTLGLLGGSQTALAAEPAQEPAPLPAWSYGMLADGYALGLFGDEIYTSHSQTVTQEQLDHMTQVVADKLALLEVETRPAGGEALVLDTTRGGVVNALYQEAAAYAFPGVEAGAEEFMTSVGALAGDGVSLRLEEPCTLLEAATMADSLILNLYDQENAGSLGLLWKADNGAGNTLYLLGSIHTDVNNTYPIHKQLRDIILDADLVAFELDFNDQEQIAEFAAMQVYSDGTTLVDHISPELYQVTVEAAAMLGMDEQTVAQYKAWALASTFQSLATVDETTSSNAMAIDLYVNAKAGNAGIPIDAVETYAFQGGIFDGLSPEYQEAYLAGGLLMVLDVDTMDQETRDALAAVLGEDALEPATQEAIQAQLDQISAMMDTWKDRDPEEFDKVYGKDAILESDDELNSKLFIDRDPGMIQYAADYLSQEGSHTGLLVVGAGHMVGDTGIVQGLKDLGYTVEVVPHP